MIEVYRVEHKETGVGPFQTDLALTQFLAKRLGANTSYLPLPYEDGLGLADIPWWFVFGCPTIEDLKPWILLGLTVEENQRIVDQLDQLGFHIGYYVVEDSLFRMGRKGTQLVFGKSLYDDECQSDCLPIHKLLEHPPVLYEVKDFEFSNISNFKI